MKLFLSSLVVSLIFCTFNLNSSQAATPKRFNGVLALKTNNYDFLVIPEFQYIDKVNEIKDTFNKGNYKAVETLASELLVDYPDRPECYYYIALVLQTKNKHKEAIETLNDAKTFVTPNSLITILMIDEAISQSQTPSSPDNTLRLAQEALNNNQRWKAAKLYEASWNADQTRYDVGLTAAELMCEFKQWEKCIVILNSLKAAPSSIYQSAQSLRQKNSEEFESMWGANLDLAIGHFKTTQNYSIAMNEMDAAQIFCADEVLFAMSLLRGFMALISGHNKEATLYLTRAISRGNLKMTDLLTDDTEYLNSALTVLTLEQFASLRYNQTLLQVVENFWGPTAQKDVNKTFDNLKSIQTEYFKRLNLALENFYSNKNFDTAMNELNAADFFRAENYITTYYRGLICLITGHEKEAKLYFSEAITKGNLTIEQFLSDGTQNNLSILKILTIDQYASLQNNPIIRTVVLNYWPKDGLDKMKKIFQNSSIITNEYFSHIKLALEIFHTSQDFDLANTELSKAKAYLPSYYLVSFYRAFMALATGREKEAQTYLILAIKDGNLTLQQLLTVGENNIASALDVLSIKQFAALQNNAVFISVAQQIWGPNSKEAISNIYQQLPTMVIESSKYRHLAITNFKNNQDYSQAMQTLDEALLYAPWDSLITFYRSFIALATGHDQDAEIFLTQLLSKEKIPLERLLFDGSNGDLSALDVLSRSQFASLKSNTVLRTVLQNFYGTQAVNQIQAIFEQFNVEPLKIQNFTSGGWHNCVIDGEGAKCWGNNKNNQLASPKLNAPEAIVAGLWHTCALDHQGVKCWGFINSVPDLKSPRAIFAGGYFNCAIDEEGLKCWGDNSLGQLNVPTLNNPKAIATGKKHACAIDGNKVVCWGDNSKGQLAIPKLVRPYLLSAFSDETCAVDANGLTCWGSWNYSDSTLTHPRSLAVGSVHVCTIDDNGIKCWGNNTDGQLEIPTLVHPQNVYAGENHTCAIDDNGVHCWGANNLGQLNSPPIKRTTKFIKPYPVEYPSQFITTVLSEGIIKKKFGKFDEFSYRIQFKNTNLDWKIGCFVQPYISNGSERKPFETLYYWISHPFMPNETTSIYHEEGIKVDDGFATFYTSLESCNYYRE